MKKTGIIRDSGMPKQRQWESYFNPEETLTRLGLSSETRNVIEVGCGYGTFSIPAAGRIKGILYGFDKICGIDLPPYHYGLMGIKG